MTTEKKKTVKQPRKSKKVELLPQNVIPFKKREDRPVFTAELIFDDVEEMDGGLTQEYIKQSSFEEVQARNAEIQRRIKEERAKANKSVLKSYNIKD